MPAQDAVSALQKAAGVVHLYRTPALTQSATSKLLDEAHEAGLAAISSISTELVRSSPTVRTQPHALCKRAIARQRMPALGNMSGLHLG